MRIVTGKQLVAGDNIVNQGVRVAIKDCGPGKGAGDFEFGEYVWIKPDNGSSFWLFENSPIVLL